MTSSRYPGKMLAPFLGKPIFANVVDRIKKSKVNLKIILATSNHRTDDPLALYAKNLGVDVVRGSLEDVMTRFIQTLRKFECEAFFRICGDSPLLYPILFEKAFAIYNQGNYDLVTNIYPKTFPPGMSVELIKTKTFIKTENMIKNVEDREHITQYFYKKSKEFKIYNIENKNFFDPNLNLALDKPEDLKKLEECYKNRNEIFESLFPIV